MGWWCASQCSAKAGNFQCSADAHLLGVTILILIYNAAGESSGIDTRLMMQHIAWQQKMLMPKKCVPPILPTGVITNSGWLAMGLPWQVMVEPQMCNCLITLLLVAATLPLQRGVVGCLRHHLLATHNLARMSHQTGGSTMGGDGGGIATVEITVKNMTFFFFFFFKINFQKILSIIDQEIMFT